MATLVEQHWQSASTARDRQPGPFRTAIGIALCAFAVTGSTSVAAQQSTPSAVQDIPTASECTVQPRPEDDLRALFREVAATPLPASVDITRAEAPAGTPADEQTVAEINATWRMFVACLNAGDQARMFALYSD